jgi:hypothetical protein
MAQIRIKKEYRGLTRQVLLDKVYDLGYNFCQNSHSCSQSTVAALHEILGFDDIVVRLATSQCAGSAMQFLGTCGTLAGGSIVFDYFYGRPVEKMSYREFIQSNVDVLDNALEAPRLLADRLVDKYGTIICLHIHRRLFGRPYPHFTPEDILKNREVNIRLAPNNCWGVVGDAARWVMEILLDKGVVELE